MPLRCWFSYRGLCVLMNEWVEPTRWPPEMIDRCAPFFCKREAGICLHLLYRMDLQLAGQPQTENLRGKNTLSATTEHTPHDST